MVTCQRCAGPMLTDTMIGFWDADERYCLYCGAREYPDATAQDDGVAGRNALARRYVRVSKQRRHAEVQP